MYINNIILLQHIFCVYFSVSSLQIVFVLCTDFRLCYVWCLNIGPCRGPVAALGEQGPRIWPRRMPIRASMSARPWDKALGGVHQGP